MDLYDNIAMNSFEVCWQIVKSNTLPINKNALYRHFIGHPYPNSLMAISDIMEIYNITMKSYRIDDLNSLVGCQYPKIGFVNIDMQPYFCLIYQIKSDTVVWCNPLINKRESISYEDFMKLYAGIITIVDIHECSEEFEHTSKYQSVVIKIIEAIPIAVLSIATISIILSICSSEHFVAFGMYLGGLLCGNIVCLDILLYENKKKTSKLTEKVCHIKKGWNCSDILKSSVNNLLGISWSTIGLSYFAGVLLALACVDSSNVDNWKMASLLNLCALPFILYSLYIQIVVRKHLCVVCLSVISILLYLFTVSLWNDFLLMNTNVKTYVAIPFCIIFLVVLWGGSVYTGLNYKNQKYNEMLQGFNSLRFNKKVFSLLQNEYPMIEDVPLDMSINIGNPTASERILKICNPFCTACSISHLAIEKILKRKDFFLQIVFIVPLQEDKLMSNVIKLFFAIKHKYGDDYMTHVLHEWYNQNEKNYYEFRAKYSEIDNDLIESQYKKIEWMKHFAEKMDVQYTPAFFINNRHLPDDFYSYNDFDYLLKRKLEN